MRKVFLGIVSLGLGVAFACSGTTYFYRGEQVEPGVFRVLRGYGWEYSPDVVAADTIGISRIADFKTYYQNMISDNDLVFIGSLDSVIENHYPDTVLPAEVVPQFNLAPKSSVAGMAWGYFYARIQVDTLLKGNLPSKQFWIKGHWIGNTCDVAYSYYKGLRFVNYSDKLDSMTDLKVAQIQPFCSNCPRAHTFDGRYLRSPAFPVLALDITELYPDYPATGIVRRANPVVPWRPTGKAYRPDGRTVPEAPVSGRKSPVPVLK